MESTQFKLSKNKPQSGTSKPQLPKILPYTKLLALNETPNIKGVFCYVIKHYGSEGLSTLIYRQPNEDGVTILFGDWLGNSIDIQTNNPTRLTDAANNFVSQHVVKFVNLMHSVNILQTQLFFGIDDDGLILVDMQLSLNKFAGPGMVRDLFGNLHRTQEVVKMEIIDDRALEAIERGTGSYNGDLILKPSSFKMHHNPKADTYQPLYVEVRR